jgi:hypothetical protein
MLGISVSENALLARLTGLQFAVQVAAVVSLVEAFLRGYYGGQEGHGHEVWQHNGPFDHKVPLGALRRQTPQTHFKGNQGVGGRGGSDSRRRHSRARV